MTGRGKFLNLEIETSSKMSFPTSAPATATPTASASAVASTSASASLKYMSPPFKIDEPENINHPDKVHCIGRGNIIRSLAPELNRGCGRAALMESLAERFNIQLQHGDSKKKSSNEEIDDICNKEKRNTSKDFNLTEVTTGIKGTPINLYCNYIRLISDPNKGVYEYEVHFVPPVDSFRLRTKYLNEHKDKYGDVKAFDGQKLCLPILLKEKLTIYVSKNEYDGSDIQIRILFKKKESSRNCIHLYNILFNRIMHTLNYVQIERKQYDPSKPKIIPEHKLELWPGYVTTVDEFDGGLLLNCDISHRLLCQKTVFDVLSEIYGSKPQDFINTARRALLGSSIITRYNNKHYRIDDLVFDKNPQSTFLIGNEEISFLDYYRVNYNIEIKDKKQPLIISIRKQRQSQTLIVKDVVICLVPELCHLTGLRDDIRTDKCIMREISTFTRLSPNQRLQALRKFYTNINESKEASKILEDWGLKLDGYCTSLKGRTLDNDTIHLGKTKFTIGNDVDFSKQIASHECLETIPIYYWVLIYCKTNARQAQLFSNNLEKCAKVFGITIHKPQIAVLGNDRIEVLVNTLRKTINTNTQIVVCILSHNRQDKYSAIKKICCSEIPIPSQVIIAKTLENDLKNRSIVQKIVLQMNCKLGGPLWSIHIPLRNVMICGIDVYHENSKSKTTATAFVASINHNFTKWYSKATLQNKYEEILNGLCSCLVSSLSAYIEENGKHPDNVIIYRDGIGDGHLNLCKDYEIPQLENACNLKLGFTIKITFIVVRKRITTRYFVGNENSFSNPMRGTIVDHTITRSNLYDFFLISQQIRCGTVNPTHYIVLRDDASYNPDIIQRLTYKLCFLYYNWPGSIRVPASCQYAHKLAYLVGQSVCRPVAEKLSTKLFYL